MSTHIVPAEFVDFEKLKDELFQALGGPDNVGLSARVTDSGKPVHYTGHWQDPEAQFVGQLAVVHDSKLGDYGKYTEHQAVEITLVNDGDLDKAKAVIAEHAKKYKPGNRGQEGR